MPFSGHLLNHTAKKYDKLLRTVPIRAKQSGHPICSLPLFTTLPLPSTSPTFPAPFPSPFFFSSTSPTLPINKLVSASSPLDLSMHRRRLIKVFTPPPRESSAEVHDFGNGKTRYELPMMRICIYLPEYPHKYSMVFDVRAYFYGSAQGFRMGQDSIDDLLLPLNHPAHTYPIPLYYTYIIYKYARRVDLKLRRGRMRLGTI